MPRPRLPVGLLALLALAAPALGAEEPAAEEYAREPPAEIVTAVACGECHAAALEVWQGTAHQQGFRELHRRPEAQTIAAKLGFRLLKRDSLCLRCHYTPVEVEDELRAVSGVSCESCHGAGRDWIKVHNDYGPGHDHDSEPPEHRRRRIEASRAAGMRRPSDLYGVAASCFACHTVPEERLVNAGGHTAGSAGLELVAASQGAMRHNFLASSLTGDGTVNRERPPAERRLMYVVGRAVALEYALRAAAVATEPGTYARAAGQRVQVAALELRKIAELTPMPEIDEMLAAVRGVPLAAGNREPLLAAAERVGAAARRIPGHHRPTELAALDPLVRGEPLPELEPEPEPAAAGADRLAAAGAEGGAPPSVGEGESAGEPGAGTAGTEASAGRPAVGEVKRRIRPASDHRTLGQLSCSGCHQEANAWWATDPHSRSAQPFFHRDPERVKIARLYGVPPADLTQGNRVCMDCHGTVISGNERFDVFDGVSCESCHGAAADYLEPHKAGDKSLGVERPGYRDGLRLGMNELRDLTVRARVCTSCHYITDQRLISSGHTTGEGFDYVGGMARTRHWTRKRETSEIAAAFSPVLAARGPVPDVPRGELPTASARQAAAGAPAGSAGSAAAGAALPGGAAASIAPGTPAAGAGLPGAPPAEATGPLELPPFPEIDESATIDELLELLQERLEQLYRAVEPEP